MSQMGQERRIGAVCNISALPPRADVGADIVERPLSASCGHTAARAYVKEVPTPELAASLALTIGDGYVHHKLALRRMTGNVPLTRRILGQHDASGRESPDVAIARLKLNLAG